MNGTHEIFEFLLIAFFLQPLTPIEQIKLVISCLPDNCAFRKKCEMAVAWREGRTMELFSMAFGEFKDSDMVPQANIDSPPPLLDSTSSSPIELKDSLTDFDRDFILEIVKNKGNEKFCKKEKHDIATLLGVSVEKVRNRIKYIRSSENKQKDNKKVKKVNGSDSLKSEDIATLDYSVTYDPLVIVDSSPKE